MMVTARYKGQGQVAQTVRHQPTRDSILHAAAESLCIDLEAGAAGCLCYALACSALCGLFYPAVLLSRYSV
jgi:hypothetical protein